MTKPLLGILALTATAMLVAMCFSEQQLAKDSSGAPDQMLDIHSAIAESWTSFVGRTGAVDERAALEKVNAAIAMLEGAQSAEAEEYAGRAYNNLGVIYNCSVDARVRDKRLASEAFAQVVNTDPFFLNNTLWAVFWGGAQEDLVNTREQYMEMSDRVSDSLQFQVRDRYPDVPPLEVLKILYEQRSEVSFPQYIAAQQIAFYYECRAEPQDLGRAIEWYQNALERLPETPYLPDLDSDLPDDGLLSGILYDLSVTALEADKQQISERLRRLQLLIGDQ